jgi:hypothetical protein
VPGEGIREVEDLEHRRIDCFLNVHVKVDDVEQHLQVHLILHVSAGCSPSQKRLAVFDGQARGQA